MTSIVLAGGKSLRLGSNKLLEAVGGRPLLGRVLNVLNQVSDQVIVVVAQGQKLPAVATDAHPLVTADIYPGKGALGGIYTGVLASGSFHNLVVGADMPFLSPHLLQYLMSLSPGFDVVMPSIRREIEPLHAVYSKRCLEPMRQQIERADLAIRHLLEEVRVRYVREDEIDRFDPSHLSFFNVNTPSDLKKAVALSQSMD